MTMNMILLVIGLHLVPLGLAVRNARRWRADTQHGGYRRAGDVMATIQLIALWAIIVVVLTLHALALAGHVDLGTLAGGYTREYFIIGSFTPLMLFMWPGALWVQTTGRTHRKTWMRNTLTISGLVCTGIIVCIFLTMFLLPR